jgi:hypothetical protein
VRKEVLYNILKEFGVPMKQVRLIKMYYNETYSKAPIGKQLCDSSPIQNDPKQGDASLPLFSILPKDMHLGKSRKTR